MVLERFKAKENKKVLIGIVIAVIAVIVAVVIGIVASQGGDNAKLQKLLDAGQKYLAEMNYEQAIAVYEEVIALEPKNVEAYLGMAEAYIGMGDTESAIKALETGYEITKDKRLQDMLEGLLAGDNAEVNNTEENLPEDTSAVADTGLDMTDEELLQKVTFINNYYYSDWGGFSSESYAMHLTTEERNAILSEFVPILREAINREVDDLWFLYLYLNRVYVAMGDLDACLALRQEATAVLGERAVNEFTPEEYKVTTDFFVKTYDAYGRCLEDVEDTNKYTYEYSEVSGLDAVHTVYVIDSFDGIYNEHHLEYDSEGRISAYVYCSENGSRNMRHTYTYEGNRVTDTTEYFGTDTAWAESCSEDQEYRVYTIDELGRCVSREWYREGELYSTKIIKYNEDGTSESQVIE